MNFDSEGNEKYDAFSTHERNEYRQKPNKLKLNMNHPESPPSRQSILEAPKVELMALPPHLRYMILRKDDTLTVIIVAKLNGKKVKSLVGVYKRFNQDIGWIIPDIIVIPLGIGSQEIKLMPDNKSSIVHKRSLNPPGQEVVKKEIISGWMLKSFFLLRKKFWCILFNVGL